jgi:GT2 family glycosyltransferase
MIPQKVLISILNWNKAQQTLVCLDSLKGELNTHFCQVTILVIDNGSAVEECSLLESKVHERGFLFKRLPNNIGFTGGHNIAIELAIDEKYDFIWLMNNDALVEPGALAELLAAMRNNPRCGAASPVIRWQDDELSLAPCIGTHDWMIRSCNRISSIQEAQRMQIEHPETVWLVGTAIFFRVEALIDVGLLNEDMFAYYDDNDIGVRLSARNWHSQCVFTTSVIHEAKGKGENLPLYTYYLSQRNELLFWHENTPAKFRRFLWLKLIDNGLFDVNRLYQRGLKRQGDAALLGILDFICLRFGAPNLDRKVPYILRLACRISAAFYVKKLSPVKLQAGSK